MITEIPYYGLKAYALFYSKHGTREAFKQSDLDWIVGQSLKKKIFALLLKTGWIKKRSYDTYVCNDPDHIMQGLVEFKVPTIIIKAERPYAFTQLSAVEIWSDYSYVQRGIEKSPYFIKVLRKDLAYWKQFFSTYKVPCYIKKGSMIGEYIILIPVRSLRFVDKDGYKVESFDTAIKIAKSNEIYLYAYHYMRKKYGSAG